MYRNPILSIAVTVGCLAALAPERAAAQDLTTVRITTGFSLPLYACSPPGDADRLFVVQQRGRIRIIDLNTNSILGTDFLNLTGIASTSGNERGLLGLAFHPDYAANGKFYVSYTAQTAGHASRVIEYTVSGDPNVANPTAGPTIFGISQPFSNHNGGCIQFGPDGKLYVAMGDGGSANDPGNRAQNLGNNLGKMLRFDVDIPAPYIPGDNPFVGVTGSNDEIWAYGLRNPWRFSFDRLTGDMYIGDVGQNAWEEVDFQPASSTGGENYGWRCREGAHPFNTSGCPPVATMVDPIFEFNHAGNCSITGGYVYRGSAIPGLQGTYFTADYCSNRIWSFRYDGTNLTEEMMRQTELDPPVGNINSITSFGEDGAGELYIVDQGGEIYKIIEDVPPCVGSATTYCVTSPNGAGSGAVLFPGSNTDIADNNFSIAIGGGIPGNFGIFFYGLAPGQSTAGNGMLCVDTTQGLHRVYPVVPIDGLLGIGNKVFDFTTPPMDSGPGAIVPGTSYYFQFWYRDPGGPGGFDYNFSDGVVATFCP